MIGALAAVVVTLASVVAYLFKRYERRDDKREKAIVDERAAMDRERASWAVERERLRADYEARNAELSETYATALRQEHKDARDHEDEVRADFAAIMERVEAEASQSSRALVDMLQKFYERFVGPRARY